MHLQQCSFPSDPAPVRLLRFSFTPLTPSYINIIQSPSNICIETGENTDPRAAALSSPASQGLLGCLWIVCLYCLRSRPSAPQRNNMSFNNTSLDFRLQQSDLDFSEMLGGSSWWGGSTSWPVRGRNQLMTSQMLSQDYLTLSKKQFWLLGQTYRRYEVIILI